MCRRQLHLLLLCQNHRTELCGFVLLRLVQLGGTLLDPILLGYDRFLCLRLESLLLRLLRLGRLLLQLLLLLSNLLLSFGNELLRPRLDLFMGLHICSLLVELQLLM